MLNETICVIFKHREFGGFCPFFVSMSYCALTESSYDFSLQILIFFGFRSGDFDGTFMMLLLPRFFASSVPASWFVVEW